MPAMPAGVPSAPWGPGPLSPGTPRGEVAEHLFLCLRKFRHLENKWCPVPYFGTSFAGGTQGPSYEAAAFAVKGIRSELTAGRAEIGCSILQR
jgi:hypothetical protein